MASGPGRTWCASRRTSGCATWSGFATRCACRCATMCGWNGSNRAATCWHCICETQAGPEIALTRKLVLATGIEGAGVRRVPDFVRDNLPRETWAHTSDTIDFAPSPGRRVAVIGGGASAFDNAATALEAWRGMGRRLHPPAGSAGGEFIPCPGIQRLLAQLSATCRMRIAGASCATCCRCRCRRRRTRCNARCAMPM